jgi:transcriptional regulator GlxA family with amidase domain
MDLEMNNAAKTVAIVLFDDVLLLDFSGPAEVFAVANRYLPEHAHYRILTLSACSREIRASNGVRLTTDCLLNEAEQGFDLLLVPGGPGAYDASYPEITQWLPDAVKRSSRYAAVCTGAFILGEAGLLDGRRVTTHWNYVDRLASRFPNAMVEMDQIYIFDQNLVTSGGVTAGMDMALAIVAEDHGKYVALDVAKVLLVAVKRQGDQRQFSPLLAAIVRDGSPIAKAQAYIVDHIDEPLTIEKLAGVATMSPRNFTRLFQRQTKLTPIEYVQNARVDFARKLLEQTDLPLKTIAARSGFGTPRRMRYIFVNQLGLTPTQYKEQFGTT